MSLVESILHSISVFKKAEEFAVRKINGRRQQYITLGYQKSTHKKCFCLRIRHRPLDLSDSRWLLETTAAGPLALISPAQALWGMVNPATALFQCHLPTVDPSGLQVEHRAQQGVPIRSRGLLGAKATVLQQELCRLRRTRFSRLQLKAPLQQERLLELWPPPRRT